MKVTIARVKDIKAITELLNQSADLLHAKNIMQWGDKLPQADMQNEIAKGRVYKVVSFGNTVAVFSLRDSDYFWLNPGVNPESVYLYYSEPFRQYISFGSYQWNHSPHFIMPPAA